MEKVYREYTMYKRQSIQENCPSSFFRTTMKVRVGKVIVMRSPRKTGRMEKGKCPSSDWAIKFIDRPPFGFAYITYNILTTRVSVPVREKGPFSPLPVPNGWQQRPIVTAKGNGRVCATVCPGPNVHIGWAKSCPYALSPATLRNVGDSRGESSTFRVRAYYTLPIFLLDILCTAQCTSIEIFRVKDFLSSSPYMVCRNISYVTYKYGRACFCSVDAYFLFISRFRPEPAKPRERNTCRVVRTDSPIVL